MTHIAFDLGLKTTGVAWSGGSDHHVCPPKLRGGERLAWWRDTFQMLILPYGTWPNGRPTIVVEGPFIHPKHITGAMALVELHAVLRLVAHDASCDYVEVAPAKLKKWATDDGRAPKVAMLWWAQSMGWKGTDHNEADAWLLYRYHQENK